MEIKDNTDIKKESNMQPVGAAIAATPIAENNQAVPPNAQKHPADIIYDVIMKELPNEIKRFTPWCIEHRKNFSLNTKQLIAIAFQNGCNFGAVNVLKLVFSQPAPTATETPVATVSEATPASEPAPAPEAPTSTETAGAPV